MFYRRRFSEILFAYAALFLIAFYFSFSKTVCIVLAAVTAVLLFVVIAMLFRRRMRGFSALLCLLAVILPFFAICCGAGFAARVDETEALGDGKTHVAVARVKEVRYEESFGSAYVVQLISLDGEDASHRVLWEVSRKCELTVGDTVSFEAVWETVEGEYAPYHRSRKILLTAFSEDYAAADSSIDPMGWIYHLRLWIRGVFERKIGTNGAGFAAALTIGDRSGLDPQIRLAYQRLGLSHLIAVSGLHFSLLLGMMESIFLQMRLRYGVRNGILLVFTVFFGLICGFSGSVARAAVMFVIHYTGKLIGEESDSFLSLSIATAGVMTFSPFAVYDAGFWLSVTATLGLVVVMPGLFKRREEEMRPSQYLVRYVQTSLAMTFSATLFTLPIVYAIYGGIPLLLPVANLIMMPIVQLMLYLFAFLAMLGWVPWISDALGFLSRGMIALSDGCVTVLSGLRGIYFMAGYPFSDWIMIGLTVSLIASLFFTRAKLKILVTAFTCCVTAFFVCFFAYAIRNAGVSTVHLVTDGKNDVLLLVDGGEAMLADITTGGREIPMQAIDVLAEKYHIGEIDSFLVTHIHENHVSSLKRLADTVMIRRVLLPEPQTEAEARYVAMLRERLNGACAVEFYRRDGTDTVRVGDTEVTLPRYETIARSTHPVITFSAACGNGDRWIYCGASAMELFDTWDAVRGCDTLILGAHGPKEKYFIDEECLEDVKQIIVANEESAELLRVDETKTAVVTVNADCAIRFERERRQTVP